MRASILTGTAVLLVSATTVVAEETFPATLTGHAILPAGTFIVAPDDAPADLKIAGKFTGSTPAYQPATVPGDTGPMHGKRPTGLATPFQGQAVQGLSGFAMNRAQDGSVYVLTDNGFGGKGNSPDAMLFFNRMTPDFAAGTVQIAETVFLHDPDRKVPFRITSEGSEKRYLTGADFDPESIQLVNNEIWIGEEFGPYLIRATTDGKVLAIYPTMIDGTLAKGPDTPGVQVPAQPGKDFTVQRSGGYEVMGLQPGTGLLWGILEKPLFAATGEPEGTFVRAMAFDPAKGEWTGQFFKFALGEGAVSIGDMNFIDDTRALVIERDNGEGDPSLKCEGDAKPDCFPMPAMAKRVVLIDTASIDADGFVKRIGSIDLMDIADPNGMNRLPTVARRDLAGKFTFPFFTIEDVMRVDDTHILVANDNNLPFSSGRQLDQAAANEFILLSVPELLSAR
ncbi:MAG: hypothetical protein DI533_00785 [Cereibacter sphaeroides]|uniref:Phytase-like domain-containing protein n=1 Tax=Cereibacter sphaeroides TaxID=1063 RepID=A0A2W5U759_CERSP|nr:MAG: hypothetical protein DI533_00785 [Cereibacter sphaeroides]